jgi:hypothetical protein
VLPQAEADVWNAVNIQIRNKIINHVRAQASARSCEQYNAIILTAGFKPSIKTKIMGANLTVLADIKDLALKTETLEIEKWGKSNAPNLMVNPVKENEDVDALYQGQRFRGNYRGGSRGGSGPSRGNRGGYNGGDRGGFKRDQKPGQNSQTRVTKTILKQDPKTNKQWLLTKGATMVKIMTGEDRTLLDNKTDRESGVLIVAKLRTTQLNVGAIKRKLSTTSMMRKMNSLKIKKKNHSVTLFNNSSKQKTKN